MSLAKPFKTEREMLFDLLSFTNENCTLNNTFVIHKSYEWATSLDESNTLQDPIHALMEILVVIHLVTNNKK